MPGRIRRDAGGVGGLAATPIPLLFGAQHERPGLQHRARRRGRRGRPRPEVNAQLDLETSEGRAGLPAAQGPAGSLSCPSPTTCLTVVARARSTGRTCYELRQLKLYEVGVVPIGANQETELLAVKSAARRARRRVKAGRVLAARSTSTPCARRRRPSARSSPQPRRDQEKASAARGQSGQGRGAPRGQVRGAQQPTCPSDHYLAVISIAERN